MKAGTEFCNMSGKQYKLSSVLYGHSADVRSVATSVRGDIVSGSRDTTAKLWSNKNTIDHSFVQVTDFAGHSNFVSSVCFLPPSSKHPKGLVVTGSNDKSIRIFDPDLTIPIRVLNQHSNTVCKVTAGVLEWTLFSSSWDGTARGWKNNGEEWPSVTFTGHTATVWSVCQLPNGIVVTASADKTLRVYEKSSAFLRVLNGHTDCVRDVVCVGPEEVASAANDATIRIWNVVSGECLNTLHGHGHYIYSIAVMPCGDSWATSSEDKTVKIWSAQGEMCSILLPCASVWCVTVLPNGDVVTGTNDGIIRVFTADPSRVADAQTQAAFEAQLASSQAESSQNVGGVKLSELPGKDALLEPGRKDGQTKMVREGNKANAYAWSVAEGTWHLIGEVVGGSGSGSNETGKTVHNGKEYDYVFNVDIDDGAPPIKLPYNKTEDPWQAAQKFIHDNNLPQSYLDQVANFIITNSRQEPQQPIQSNFVDPFTGSTRYVPQPGASNGGDTGISNASSLPQIQTRFIPQREFLRFDQANVSAIKDKLISLNQDKKLGVSEDAIKSLLERCDSFGECNKGDLETLDELLSWPVDAVFPALDVTRLIIRKNSVSEHLCSDNFLEKLQSYLQDSPNNMLALRICSNMMSSDAGENLASRQRIKLIEFLLSVPLPYSKPIQVALSTLLLNLAVLLRRSETSDGRQQLLMASTELVPSFNEQEALFRSLVALGTLLWDSKERSSAVESFLPFLQQCSGDTVEKIRECAGEVLAITR